MGRTPNAVETRIVKLSTTPWVEEALEILARTGRFGKNGSEVGEELLRAKLRDVELEGWLRKKPARRASSRRS